MDHHAAVATAARTLLHSLPASKAEAASIFTSGALAGFALEAAVHGARAAVKRHQQLRAGHPLGTLRAKWWLAALRTPAQPYGPYQGAVGTLAAGTIWSGIFGSFYVPVRAAVDATLPDQPAWGPAVAAAAGSVASSTVRVPLQVVKGRIEHHEFFCSLQAFERILLREGVRSLYVGWVRSVLKNAPFDAALFCLYDQGKTRLTRSRAAHGPDGPAVHGPGMAPAPRGAANGSADADAGFTGRLQAAAGAAAAEAEAHGQRHSCDAAPGLGSDSSSSVPAPYGIADAALVGGAAGFTTGLLTCPVLLARLTYLEARRARLAAAASASPTAAAAATAATGLGGAGEGRGGTAPLSGVGAVRAAPLHIPPTEASSGAAATAAAPGKRWREAAWVRALAGMDVRMLAGRMRSRVLWAALEGAVFFPSLEAAIPLCDWLFLEGDEEEGEADGEWHAPLRHHHSHMLHW